jgi:hypothetical protein
MFSSEMTLASAWIHLLVIDLFAARLVLSIFFADPLKLHYFLIPRLLLGLNAILVLLTMLPFNRLITHEADTYAPINVVACSASNRFL